MESLPIDPICNVAKPALNQPIIDDLSSWIRWYFSCLDESPLVLCLESVLEVKQASRLLILNAGTQSRKINPVDRPFLLFSGVYATVWTMHGDGTVSLLDRNLDRRTDPAKVCGAQDYIECLLKVL